MGAILNLVERNLHEVHVDADRMLFHIPSSSLFASDELTGTIIDTLRGPGCSSDDLIQRLAARFNGEEITETLRELMALELVSDGSPLTPDIATKRVERTAINTVVLNVNTGCNLSCTYCYKEDLDKPSAGKKMDVETAIASVEMLLRESPDEERFTVVFFGGEPLSNRKLIEYMVDYCEKRFPEAGKFVEFVMTTNATLLTEDTVDYLNAHRFGLSVSIDGPKTVHDRNRITVGGQGTYDVVRRKAEMLLSRYNSRPVGARVTLTTGVTDVETIWDHLFNELGFAEVGFAPVTSGDISSFNLTSDELIEVFASMKTPRSALPGSGAGAPQHRFLQPASADHRHPRRPQESPAVRRGPEDAGGGSQGRAEPVPPLYRFEPADLRQRPQRRETGGVERLPVPAPGPQQHRLRRLPDPQPVLRRLLPRELRPLRRPDAPDLSLLRTDA